MSSSGRTIWVGLMLAAGGCGAAAHGDSSASACPRLEDGGDSLVTDVADLLCNPGDADGSESESVFRRHHRDFDDRHPSPVAAALIVTDCVRRNCQVNATSGYMVEFYASLYDHRSLRAAVATLPLAEESKSAFVALVVGATR